VNSFVKTIITSAPKRDDRLGQTLAAVLGVEPASLQEHSSPDTVPQWDSVNHLNLVMALESEFGVSVSADETVEMRSVAAIRTILRQKGVEV
jgi:acyl carrier protein